MKKLLGIVVLGLLFASPTLGKDCSIKTPTFDWSKKLWMFDGKDVYDDKRLGESYHLKSPHRNKSFSYYTYNKGLNFIDQKTLDKELSVAIGDMQYVYSKSNKKKLKDQMYILPINKFQKFLVMKNFISKGVFGESLFETSTGSKRYLEIVAVGTDNYCFHKIRYSTQLSMASDALPYALRIFELDLEMFYEAMKN
tara:strand:- start:66 stop:653 length:588 start_codon:yes stop_codon:yes gene_type:complete